jgi:hypothetical protein
MRWVGVSKNITILEGASIFHFSKLLLLSSNFSLWYPISIQKVPTKYHKFRKGQQFWWCRIKSDFVFMSSVSPIFVHTLRMMLWYQFQNETCICNVKWMHWIDTLQTCECVYQCFFFHFPMLPNRLHSGPNGQKFGYMKLRVVKMLNYLQNKERSFKWSSFFLKALHWRGDLNFNRCMCENE